MSSCEENSTNQSCTAAQSGRAVVTGLAVNVGIFVLCYLGFVLWRGKFKIYYARLVLRQTRIKPPPLHVRGHWRFWSWLLPVFQVTDAELLRSCGLDALMAMRVMRFGIMMFSLVTGLGIAIVLPVNYTANYWSEASAENANVTSSTFMKLTISNVPQRSALLWVHTACVYIFVGWTCQLLVQYSKEFVALRQVYVAKGGREAARGLPATRRSLSDLRGLDLPESPKEAPAAPAAGGGLWASVLGAARGVVRVRGGAAGISGAGASSGGEAAGPAAGGHPMGEEGAEALPRKPSWGIGAVAAAARLFRGKSVPPPSVGRRQSGDSPADGVGGTDKGSGGAAPPLAVAAGEPSAGGPSNGSSAAAAGAARTWRMRGKLAAAAAQQQQQQQQQQPGGGEQPGVAMDPLPAKQLPPSQQQQQQEEQQQQQAEQAVDAGASAALAAPPQQPPASNGVGGAAGAARTWRQRAKPGGVPAKVSFSVPQPAPDAVAAAATASQAGVAGELGPGSTPAAAASLVGLPKPKPNTLAAVVVAAQGAARLRRRPHSLNWSTLPFPGEEANESTSSSSSEDEAAARQRQRQQRRDRVAGAARAVAAGVRMARAREGSATLAAAVQPPAPAAEAAAAPGGPAAAAEGAAAAAEAPLAAAEPKEKLLEGPEEEEEAAGPAGRVQWDLGPGSGTDDTASEEGEGVADMAFSDRVQLHAGRYTVLVLDEELQKYKLRHTQRRGFMKTAVMSMRRHQVDPKSSMAALQDEVSERAVLRRRRRARLGRMESQDAQAWAEANYRYNVAGRAFTRLFGDDFDSIIPIYPTREVDDLQMVQFKLEGGRDCLALKVSEFQARLEAKELDLEAGLGAPSAAKTPPGTPSPHAQRSPKRLPALGKATRRERRLHDMQRRLAQAEAAVEAAREAVEAKRAEVLEGPPCPSFLVTFKSQEAAALAAQINLNPMQERLFRLLPAPEPDNVNWPTLQRGWYSRSVREAVVFVVIVAIMLLPVGAWSGIMSQLGVTLCPASPDAAGTFNAYGTWFCSDEWQYTLARNALTSWLPSALLALYQAVILPHLFYNAAQAEAQHVSLSALDIRCGALFMYWNIFNLFIGALLGGSAAAALRALLEGKWNDFLNILGAALPASSSFFVNYVMFRAFSTVGLALFMPTPMVLLYILKWLHILPWARTPHDLALECPPRNRRTGWDIGCTVMPVCTVSLAYAVVAPIILPFALVFFLLMWAVWRYQSLYVYQSSYDSLGQIWTYASHRFVGCLAVLVVFSAAMLGVRGGVVQFGLLLFSLIPFLITFDLFLRRRYDSVVRQLPIIATLNAERRSLDPALYTPPPLREGSRGWYREYGKAWQYAGMPRYGL